jgi:hypothetical protein
VTADEAASMLAAPGAIDDLGPGPLVVDVDRVPAGWQPHLGFLPVVSVAVVRGRHVPTAALGGFDVVVADPAGSPTGWVTPAVDDDAGHVIDVVEAHPQASLVAAQVLRATDGASPGVALVVESLAYSVLQAGPEFQAWLAARQPTPYRAPSGPAVLVDRDGPLLMVTLNRPEVRNAVDRAVRDGLVEALQLAASDNSITDVVLRGNGPSFCSGGDLAEFGTAPDPATAHIIRTARSPGSWAAALGPRLRAEVHGACVGAGVEIAAWAGDVVATEDATFLLPEVAMGLIPGAGGTASMARRIGRQRTAYLALSGRPIDAVTALAWGLVDRVR